MSYILSDHALRRYIERFRPDILKQVTDEISQIVNTGQFVKRKSRKVTHSRYIRSGRKILVLKDRTITTALRSSKNWVKIKKFESYE